MLITGKATEQQIRAGLWKTCTNLVVIYKHRIIIVPRNFQTDNYTFVDCDIADIRASIVHDVGCKYHKMIYVEKSLKELIDEGYLKRNNNGEVECLDIPIEFLSIEDIGFVECNKVFEAILRDCKEPLYKRIILTLGVYLDLNWFIKPILGKIKNLRVDNLYNLW